MFKTFLLIEENSTFYLVNYRFISNLLPTQILTDITSVLPFLSLAFIFFLLGLFGLLYNFKNFLVSMMAVELMYLGVILSFSFASLLHSSLSIYALYLIILAACESAVGLGLLIVLYRFNQSIDLSYYTQLKTPSSRPVRLPAFVVVGLNSYNETYVALLIYFSLAVFICTIMGGLVYLLALNSVKDTEKVSEYECGFAPFDSATRRPFDVHFYLIGILFLIFDVEVALLFPWVAYASIMSEFSYYLMFTFLILLSLGFIYE